MDTHGYSWIHMDTPAIIKVVTCISYTDDERQYYNDSLQVHN